MKKLILPLLLCAQTYASLTCAPGEISILEKKLTTYWAKEYTGSDLASDFLKTLEATQEIKKVPLAIFDLGFEEEHITVERDIHIPHQLNGRRRMRANHGTSVANLLTGPTPFRMTNYADLMSLEAMTIGTMYSYAFKKYKDNDFYPRVISNSLGWSHAKLPELARNAYERDILWFLASGNDFPTPVRDLEINSKAMMVGSYAPSGLTSADTQVHPDLLVLAPANEELKTLDGYGALYHFGATSGATPLVAAAAIDILALNPVLSRDQVKSLIRDTALPSLENKLGQEQMPGLLNHYGAVMAAFNLKERCHQDQECMENAIANGDLNAGKSLNIIMCEEMKKLSCSKNQILIENKLKAMRIGVLLGHQKHRQAQARELSCAYEALGFTKNAEYYRFLSKDGVDLDELEREAVKALRSDIFQISYYRYAPLYSKEYRLFLEEFTGLNDYRRKWHLSLTEDDLVGGLLNDLKY